MLWKGAQRQAKVRQKECQAAGEAARQAKKYPDGWAGAVTLPASAAAAQAGFGVTAESGVLGPAATYLVIRALSLPATLANYVGPLRSIRSRE